jgi:hypothetical protein
MAMRSPAGFISAFFDPLKNPNAPTSPSATAGDTLATVSFTAPANVGGSAITAYYAVSNPGQITSSGASSPVTVTGLTNGTAYTFNVWALNSYGPGPWSSATGSVTPAQLLRGVFGGGFNGSQQSVLQYIDIATTGNSNTFGNLSSVTYQEAACGSSTRGVFAAGYQAGSESSAMSYITFASTGNGTSFGNLTQATRELTACNSATYGLFGTGFRGGAGILSFVDYITIATAGNGASFGALGTATLFMGGCSSPTRGIFAGGENSGGDSANIYYTTISTSGSWSSFGSLTQSRDGLGGASNATRGLFAQGYSVNTATFQSVIDYITIASTGSATFFGNCSTENRGTCGVSSSTRAVFAIGAASYPNASVTMQYVTIATTGNATNFGSLGTSIGTAAACSNCNGGTQ